ncbi:MAG: malate/lactate/ureidoglycolate dehydrogenase [Hyphomicrobiales bacterium]|nr:malate/lactate/ureidoglycolate dehydrogenase [Hyphomicrobiales bacterium]
MRHIPADALTALGEAIVRGMGGAAGEAALVARHLVDANLAGHDSHGIGMLPSYVAGIRAGKLRLGAELETLRDRGPVLLFDGQRGFGQVMARAAMERGVERARRDGLAAVGLRNSFHIGRIGAWGEICAAAGFVSLHFVNVRSRPIVAPFGGSDARFSTNPVCVALPATDDTPRVVLDMATSQIALGKARVAYHKGVPVPPGSLIDHTGAATDDPAVMFEDPKGALRPMGLHKGYALAVICELLGGGLTGGGTWGSAEPEPDLIVNNMTTVILDPDLFGAGAELRRDIDAFTAWVKASPPAPGVEAVMVPGDPERRTRDERLRNGIPMDAGNWAALCAAAAEAGLDDGAVRGIVGEV